MAPPSHSGTDCMPPSTRKQRKNKCVPVIKIVQVHAPKHVWANVSNFRALVQKMTGNVVPSDSRMGSPEAECSSVEPFPSERAVSRRSKHLQAPMAGLPPPLQHVHRRPCGSEKCPTSAQACTRASYTQSEGIKEVKREAWTGENDCPGEGVEDMQVSYRQSGLSGEVKEIKREEDTIANESSAECAEDGELDHESQSPETSACESARYRPLHITHANAAILPHEDSVDSFFADGGDGDDNGHHQDYESPPTTCRYSNNGNFSSIGNVYSAAYNNYLPPFNCGWRASYEMPGGFDYFSV